MPQYTSRRQLIKPQGSDKISIQQLNSNMDRLDLINDAPVTSIASSSYLALRDVKVDYPCNGTLDEDKFQTAIDLASSRGGGIIEIFPGNYVFNKLVCLKSNVYLRFMPGACLKIADQQSSPITQDYHRADTAIQVQNPEKFKVGQHIGIVRGPEGGYKTGYLRQIDSINGNTLHINMSRDIYTDHGPILVSEAGTVVTHFSLFHLTAHSTNVIVEGAELDGNKANNPIWVVNRDSGMNGILGGDYCDKIWLKNLYVHDFLFQGIHPCGLLADSSIWIEDCVITGCQSGGICIDTSDGITYVINCTAVNNKVGGLRAIDVEGLQVVGGHYKDNGVWNISIGHDTIPTRNVVISGIHSSGGNLGVRLIQTSKAVIDSCIIEGAAEAGIKIQGSSHHNYIKGNILQDCGKGVEELGGGTDYNIIGPNYYVDCPTEVCKIGANTMVVDLIPENSAPAYQDVTFIGGSGTPVWPDGSRDSLVPMSLKGLTLSNLMGTKGDLSLHVTEYSAAHWPASWPNTRPLTIWSSANWKTVDGFHCIDGYVSDYNWPSIPRRSYLQIPTVVGHKYLVRTMVKGKRTALTHINQDTGEETELSTLYNNTAWVPQIATRVADSNPEIIGFYSLYITQDYGYFRDFLVLDLTDVGDDDLSDEQIQEKYGSLPFFNSTQSAGKGRFTFIDGSNTVHVYNPHTLRALNDTIYDSVDYDGSYQIKLAHHVLSGTEFDSLTSGTNADYITTTDCLSGLISQSAAIDGTINVYGQTEIAMADIDNAANVGKWASDADNKLRFVVTKGLYADIAAARTGLGLISLDYALAVPKQGVLGEMGGLVGSGITAVYEPYIEAQGIYDSKITVSNPEYPTIYALESVSKVLTTGELVEIPLTGVTISADKTYFTIAGAANGEVYSYVYAHSASCFGPAITVKCPKNTQGQIQSLIKLSAERLGLQISRTPSGLLSVFNDRIVAGLLSAYSDHVVLGGLIADATKATIQSMLINPDGYSAVTLAGNLVLTAISEKNQFLNCNGANRTVTLPLDADIGKIFVIKNNSAYDSTYYLDVYSNSVNIEKIYAGRVVAFIFSGTSWVNLDNAVGENDNRKGNVALGFKAQGYNNGTAIGNNAQGYSSGACLGINTIGYSYGVGVGRGADGHNYGVAVGYSSQSNNKVNAVALGAYAKCERFGEMTHTLDNSTTNKNNQSISGWKGTTTNSDIIELFLDGSSARFTILANSVVAFQIMVTARDNTSGDCACYKFAGAIKRDGSNNTALVGSVEKIVVAEDDSSWDCSVEADDINEALVIKVAGDSTNSVQWAARADTVETRF